MLDAQVHALLEEPVSYFLLDNHPDGRLGDVVNNPGLGR